MTFQRRAPGSGFVPLTTVGDVATAHILKAKLEAEGIEVRIHGFSLGPYPMLVGELAETELWVLSDRVGEASTILLDTEVNDALDRVDRPEPMPLGIRDLAWRLLAGLVAVAFAGIWLMRLVRILGF